jgi:pyrroloquinoline-quinone synthase
MSVLASLDETRAAKNILEHPFYQRWSAGELSAEELACYAGEYRRAVIALAEASARAAGKAPAEHAQALRAHAAEEESHIALWEEFATATGAREGTGAPALAETEACAHAWTQGEDLLEHLAVLYAIEASQPEVARTKLEGLTAHYGFAPEGPAVEYFTTHELRDVEHAREAGDLIEELMATVADPEAKTQTMVRLAGQALDANWRLLDGVQSRAVG